MTEFYTCDGKGGTYELLGSSKGAGTRRGTEPLMVYRDTQDGQLYNRTDEDFAARLIPVAAIYAAQAMAHPPESSVANLAAGLRTIILDAKAARHWKIADEARNALHMLAALAAQLEPQ